MIKEFITQYYLDFTPYKTKRWCYEDGILLKATLDLYRSTKDERYADFILDYLNTFINDDGYPLGYKMEEFSTDDVEPATVLFWAYDRTKSIKFKKAIDVFYEQLLDQPRCKCGNFFHKLRYPYQVWMDGLYMAQPFLVNYGLHFNHNNLIDDTIEQFLHVRKYLFDESRHLYVHAYDENKVMQWANKENGKSSNSWSRACGWMMMALVDIIELIGINDKRSLVLKGILIEMVDGLIPYLDKDYSMLYQVIDAKEDKDNYLETSGSAMMSYSLLKGYRLTILDKKYKEIGEKIFSGITRKYLKVDEKGIITLDGICQVAGLDNERRNGSKEYYYSEKIVKNEVKGVAPYFMAYSELIK